MGKVLIQIAKLKTFIHENYVVLFVYFRAFRGQTVFKFSIHMKLNKRAFKFEVRQPLVALYNAFPPRRIPRAGFCTQALFAVDG